jgi:hypothetical protein
MLTTVEAEIDVEGNVRLLEPLELTKTSRALVTVLDTQYGTSNGKGNGQKLLALLKSPQFANRKKYSVEEIDAQIEEMRNSWE